MGKKWQERIPADLYCGRLRAAGASVLVALLLLLLASSPRFLPRAWAGDEDVRVDEPVKPPPPPEPQPIPAEPEAPDMTLEEEPQSPVYNAPENAPTERSAPAPGAATPWDPDKNIDYSEQLGMAEPVPVAREVLPPALGARGYRPSLLAVEAGDRTPGYGGMVEYSWNRLGAGVFYSYRLLKEEDRYNISESFGGLYGVYRWLPFGVSPYFLAGLELGSETPDPFGGLLGLGVEARVYYGWTLLLGYTYHSTAHKGFFGGGFGWTF
jgi:hypothetical protein